MLNFVKGFFCIYWDNHMVFIFQFVNVYYIDWFADIKESLHYWDKAHLVMMYDLFNMLLDSVSWNFVKDFHSVSFKGQYCWGMWEPWRASQFWRMLFPASIWLVTKGSVIEGDRPQLCRMVMPRKGSCISLAYFLPDIWPAGPVSHLSLEAWIIPRRHWDWEMLGRQVF